MIFFPNGQYLAITIQNILLYIKFLETLSLTRIPGGWGADRDSASQEQEKNWILSLKHPRIQILVSVIT